MKAVWPLVVVISSAILGGSYIAAHRFTLAPASSDLPRSGALADTWVLDRLTGRAKLCAYLVADKVVYCEGASEIPARLVDPPPKSRGGK